MADQYNITPHYFSFEDQNSLIGSIVKDVSNTSNDLPNKYLYIGLDGALLWGKIDRSYKPGKIGENLIKNHLKNILRDCNLTKEKINLISLGCGNGDDDKIVLRNINSFNTKLIINNYFLIDLSWVLLNIGTTLFVSLVNTINHQCKRKIVENLFSLCLDIDKDLHKFSLFNKNDFTNIFLLFGLTIGNNKEYKFLTQIAQVMKENDILILTVDFSADNDDWFTESHKAYSESPESNIINEFLCSPVNIVTGYKIKAGSNEAKIGFNESKVFNKIIIDHRKDESAGVRKYSDITEGTKSLTRHHIYCQGRNLKLERLCDYSNKYSFSGFYNFISSEFKDVFQVFPNHNMDCMKMYSYKENDVESAQRLVVLKKLKPQQPITSIVKPETNKSTDNTKITPSIKPES